MSAPRPAPTLVAVDGRPGLKKAFPCDADKARITAGLAMRSARHETDMWREQNVELRMLVATQRLSVAVTSLKKLADTFETQEGHVPADRALALERRLIEVSTVLASAQRVAPPTSRKELALLGRKIEYLQAQSLAADAFQRSKEAQPYQRLLRALLHVDLEIGAGNFPGA